MIVLIVLLITSLSYIGIAFLVNEKNAKYLLSGYNTMNKQQKDKFDLKSYLIYFRKFWINIGVSSSIVTCLTFLLFSEIIMVIAHALVVIIPLPYFIYKSNKDFNSKYINDEDKKYFLKNLKSIEIFKGKINEVAVIQKK